MANYTTDLLETESAFLDLEMDWKLVLESCPHSFFQTWEYTNLWVKHYGEGVKFRVIVVRDVYGIARGIAPFIITPGLKGLRKKMKHLTLLGGLCESLAEYVDFLITPGWEHICREAVIALLKQEELFGADSLYLELQLHGSHFHHCAEQLMGEHNGLEGRGDYEGHAVKLPESWETYWAGLPAKFRANTRRYKEALVRQGLKFNKAYTPEEISAAMDALVALNADKWEGEQNIYHSKRFVAFHRELAATIAPKGWLELSTLSLEGKIVSVRYDFVYGGKVLGFQCGWDAQLKKYGPGQVHTAYALESAFCGSSWRELDFMAGGWDYQRPWKTITRHYSNWEAMNPYSLKARAIKTLRSLGQKVRQLQKVAAL